MSRDIAPFGVRMPPDLKVRIEESAAKNGRSINAEIVGRLQQTFEPSNEALSWGDLLDRLHAEAKKRGAPVTITVG